MAKQRVPLRPGESSGPQPPGSDLPPVNGSPPVEPPGQGADKNPERRYVGRLPTRVALENETAGNPSEPIAILMGMLSVFGVLFCLLLEVIDVRADVDLMSLKMSANFGLLGLSAVVFLNVVYGAVIYCRALLKRTPRRHRLPQQSATLTPSAWPGAGTSVHEPH